MQLNLGHDVIVDAANDAVGAREQWKNLAQSANVPLLFVEVWCADSAEHKRRLEARIRDIPGFPEPSWESVVARRAGFDGWEDERVQVDSMQPHEVSIRCVLDRIALARGVDLP